MLPADPTPAGRPRIRVVVRSDPRDSHRPLEALRVAAGLAAAGELEVELQLDGPAREWAHRPDAGNLECAEAEAYLRILRRAGGRVLADSAERSDGTVGLARPKAVLRF